MLIRVGNKTYRRTGECIRCGFCCHIDFVSYSEWLRWAGNALEKMGKVLDPRCSHLIHAEDGKPGCEIYAERERGCRNFPWHPDQITNTERDDLPRIPVYCDGKTEYYGLADLGPNRKFKRWAPLGDICPFRFHELPEAEARALACITKEAEKPRVIMKMPKWAEQEEAGK